MRAGRSVVAWTGLTCRHRAYHGCFTCLAPNICEPELCCTTRSRKCFCQKNGAWHFSATNCGRFILQTEIKSIDISVDRCAKRIISHSVDYYVISTLIASVALGVLFLSSGIGKLCNLRDFTQGVLEYRVLHTLLARIFSCILPFIEIFAAVALIIGVFTQVAAVIIAFLLVCFIIRYY